MPKRSSLFGSHQQSWWFNILRVKCLNIPTSDSALENHNKLLLLLLGRITRQATFNTLKEGLRAYYKSVPDLLAASFLGQIVTPATFRSQLKNRAFSDRIFLPVFEAISQWPSWNESLASALLREVIPALLGISSMQKGDNSKEWMGLALGRLAKQTGAGEVRLTSLLCPSYQYRRDRKGRLWHCSGELLPRVGPRFKKVAATLGRIFAPLPEHGVKVDWGFWCYSGETGNVEHLIDMGRFVHQHYQDKPLELFSSLGKATKDMATQIKTEMGQYGIQARACSFDREFGPRIYRLRLLFAESFPDQLEAISKKDQVEAWLDKVSKSGLLIHYFVEQEVIYRRNVRLDFTESIVSAALREMLLYTHILDNVQKNDSIIIDTESSSNYITKVLDYLPAGFIFTRSLINRKGETNPKYTLNIRQPYNVVT